MRAVTGIRPTAGIEEGLTIGNLVGAMLPAVQLQQDMPPGSVNIFVADLHAGTDQPWDRVAAARPDTARHLLAAGIEPEITTVYQQSGIKSETFYLAHVLACLTPRSELERTPAVKDRISKGEQVTAGTLFYPILMAADILIARAGIVPVGEDQRPNVEFARDLADHFNKTYASKDNPVVVKPNVLAAEGIRIASLADPNKKMSKSESNGAIFLSDSPDAVQAKLKKTQTANPGLESPALDNLLLMGKLLATEQEQADALEAYYEQHLTGEKVMTRFKEVLGNIISDYLSVHQERFHSISDKELRAILKEGGQRARNTAHSVLYDVEQAIGFKAGRAF